MVLYAAPCNVSPILNAQFTLDELLPIISKLKERKAPGPDRTPNEFYKYGPPELADSLLSLFNFIYDQGSIPSSFGHAILFPLFKKGDVNDVTNYRGIPCLNSLAKLFMSLLLARLEAFVKKHGLLSEFQAGFRKGYSVVDNIFVLSSLINLKLSKRGKKVYCFFIDFKAAFDSVNHNALYLKLLNIGISFKFVNIIRELFGCQAISVRGAHGISESFQVKAGVRQGCPLSPLLFSLFLDDLPLELE